MIDVYALFASFFSWFFALPFGLPLLFLWGGYIFVALFVLVWRLVNHTQKRTVPIVFLCITNVTSMLTFALFCTRFTTAQALLIAAVLYAIGCTWSLVLYAVKGIKKQNNPALSYVTTHAVPPPATTFYANLPAANSDVRLDHALSIIERLLQKSLGKGDRQEVEKMRNTLSVLQIKGTLSPAEGEILNDSFNALLKLMAKYNL